MRFTSLPNSIERFALTVRLMLTSCLMISGCVSDRTEEAISTTTTANGLTIEVNVEPAIAKIAEPIRLTLSATCPQGQRVGFPELGERIGETFVTDVGDPQQTTGRGMEQWTRTWTLESYQAGWHTIPSLDVMFQDGDQPNDVQVLSSDPVKIRILSVAGPFAGLSRFREVTGVVDLPRGWGDWFAPIVGITILGPLLFAGAFVISQKFFGGSREAARARRSLNRLEQHRLLDHWDAERIMTGATGVLREFLQRRLGVGSAEMTTEECLYQISRESRLTETQRRALHSILRRTDEVKFAGRITSAEDSRAAITEVRDVISQIESNKPVSQISAQEGVT